MDGILLVDKNVILKYTYTINNNNVIDDYFFLKLEHFLKCLNMKVYTISELKQQRDNINNSLLKKLLEDKILIRTLADNMAEAATNIQGQGYSVFLNSREIFLSEIDRMSSEYSSFVRSESPEK